MSKKTLTAFLKGMWVLHRFHLHQRLSPAHRQQCRCSARRPPIGWPIRLALSPRPCVASSAARHGAHARRANTTHRSTATSSAPAWLAKSTDHEFTCDLLQLAAAVAEDLNPIQLPGQEAKIRSSCANTSQQFTRVNCNCGQNVAKVWPKCGHSVRW